MALSEKKRISNDKWIKENYKQVKLSMPKSEAEELDAYCSAHNLSKAGLSVPLSKRKWSAIRLREFAQQKIPLNKNIELCRAPLRTSPIATACPSTIKIRSSIISCCRTEADVQPL